MRQNKWSVMRSSRRIMCIAVALVVVAVSGLLAHDFWIVPMSFETAPGATMTVHGQSGTRFPNSQGAVAVTRVAEVRVLSARDEERVTDLSVSGTSLVMRHTPSQPGQRVVAAALEPASRRVSAASLKRYIGLEGAPELAERYDRSGVFASFDSATMRTQKFAKSIVEVGQRGPRAFSRTAGHGLELVPVTDPTGLHPGGEMAVRVVFRGQALANAHLRAGMATDTTTNEAARPDTVIVSGNDGVARLRVTEGLWNMRLLHAGASHTDAGAWDVFFGTLVFRIAGHR